MNSINRDEETISIFNAEEAHDIWLTCRYSLQKAGASSNKVSGIYPVLS